MFGLVKQDYTLPEDILEAVGMEVFQYEHFRPEQFHVQQFTPISFKPNVFQANTLETHILRRGVISVSESRIIPKETSVFQATFQDRRNRVHSFFHVF